MRLYLVVALMVFVVSGCGSQAETPLPTSIPNDTNPSVATPIVEATTIPSSLGVRATLPPTWTPSDQTTSETGSETVAEVTPLIPTETPFIPLGTFVPECAEFEIDYGASSYQVNVGESPAFYWRGTSIAAFYQIIITRADGRIIANELIGTDRIDYSFDGRLFEAGQRYAWLIYPVNSTYQRLCLGGGADFLVLGGDQRFPTPSTSN